MSYIIKRIFKMDFGAMFDTCRYIREKEHKNRVFGLQVFIDMVRCGFKYGAGYMDYKLLHFYKLDDSKRATYLTRTASNKLVDMMNDEDSRRFMANKTDFNTIFRDFLHREWFEMDTVEFEDFVRFMTRHEFVIVKPNAANSGQGIRKIDTNAIGDLTALYDSLREQGIGIVEECVEQHEDMSRMYPDALNTIRIYTLVDSNDNVHIIKCLLRVGRDGSVVDNINAGGMFAVIDPESGKIVTPALDKHEDVHTEHPNTKTQFVGFQIPYWDRVIADCNAAAHRIGTLRYIGWDIAISSDGPVIIEGNHIPDHCILQMHSAAAGENGMIPEINKYINQKL